VYTLYPSDKKDKKWTIETPNGKRVHFGAVGYEDYTMHKDSERMKRYVERHSRGHETHTKAGLDTAGFWSRWLLWSKPSLASAIKYTETKFGITIRKQSRSTQ
jgi:hypothetical protein